MPTAYQSHASTLTKPRADAPQTSSWPASMSPWGAGGLMVELTGVFSRIDTPLLVVLVPLMVIYRFHGASGAGAVSSSPTAQ